MLSNSIVHALDSTKSVEIVWCEYEAWLNKTETTWINNRLLLSHKFTYETHLKFTSSFKRTNKIVILSLWHQAVFFLLLLLLLVFSFFRCYFGCSQIWMYCVQCKWFWTQIPQHMRNDRTNGDVSEGERESKESWSTQYAEWWNNSPEYQLAASATMTDE